MGALRAWLVISEPTRVLKSVGVKHKQLSEKKSLANKLLGETFATFFSEETALPKNIWRERNPDQKYQKKNLYQITCLSIFPEETFFTTPFFEENSLPRNVWSRPPSTIDQHYPFMRAKKWWNGVFQDVLGIWDSWLGYSDIPITSPQVKNPHVWLAHTHD